MITAIVDYNSGNLRSAEKSFQRMAAELDAGEIIVTPDPDQVRKADRVVLPGVGAFADCRRELGAIDGLFGAIEEQVKAGTPFMGICVGMQMMATVGLEHGRHEGFDWIKGAVDRLNPSDKSLKIPHMGWNNIAFKDFPLFKGLSDSSYVYYVHSFRADIDERFTVASSNYTCEYTAALHKDNFYAVQFHPEKSGAVGETILKNFINL